MGDFRDDQHHTIPIKSNLRPVAAEKVIEFAGEKNGLQRSIRLGIFAARSWLTFRDLARLVCRAPKLELIYG